MRALRIEKHGPHADLAPVDVPAPPVGPGEVRVAVEAAGINPSDVGSVEGRFAYARLPRVVGRDFAGRVVEGPPEMVGLDVWGSGGDLGIARDGTHAGSVVLPREAVAVRPPGLSAEAAAASGVPFVTAWLALVEAARVQPGEWVVVSGAAGAVGRAATEVARAHGARVVALVKDEAQAARVEGAEAVARSDRGDLADVVKAATGGRGADVALNGVGAALQPALFGALADGGRLVVYAAVAGRETTLDLFELYRRRLQIHGINTAVADATRCAGLLAQVGALFAAGTMRPLPVLERFPLDRAAEAYARVAGHAPGKIVLTF